MKTTLITVFVYIMLSSLVIIAGSGSVLAMVILRWVHLPKEVAQRALWYFKVIIISCDVLTTIVGLTVAGYIMLH